MSSKTLYIIRGVPGSGKSTLAHQLTKHVVETDDFMMVDGEYKYDKDKVYACHKKCFNKVLDYMAHGVTPIAVANTFIKKRDYKPYVDLAKEFGYNVEIKVCKGDYKNNHNVPQDRVEQMKSKFQESINSLLEMNCDTGIETIIENKKKSLFEGYDFESITKLSKTSDGYDITAMGSKIGHIVAEMDSSKQLHIGYIEILPEYRRNGIASIALSLLKDELNPTSVIANITSIASLKAFCNAFGNPSYSSNVNGMKVSPSYGLPEYPTETTNTDGEYNTCMWKLSNTIRESVEPKLNDNFKKWFGNSKCVDKNGNPKVFIHRSNAKFNAFDKSKIGQRDYGWYGKGFYFGSAKQKHYQLYGKHVYKCFLRIENPFYYNEFFGSYHPDDYQKIIGYDKLGILTPQESKFLKKYLEVYEHFDSNVKLKKVPQKVKGYNGKTYDSFYWVVQYNDKITKTDPDYNPDYNTEDYAKEMFWMEHYERHIEKIKEINRNCYKTRMDKFSDNVRKMGYDGIIHADEYVVFEPNQIKSVNNNGNWSLNSDNINEGLGQALNYGIMYHGTDDEFDEFSKDYQNGGFLGNGFYFTLSKSMARHYGKNIISAKLKYNSSFFFASDILDEKSIIKMLSTIPNLDKNTHNTIKEKYLERIKYKDYYEANKDLFDYIDFYHGDSTKILKELGYDSIDNIHMDSEFVVFEPNQIEIIKDDEYWLLEVDDINEEKEVIEEMERFRQKFKQKLNIKESANNSTNMTWEEFVEKVGRENEFDGSVVISKHNTSIIIRQSGRILVRRLGKKPFMKAYSNLKTFDEIYNMLVEKGFIEEQILTEAVNQHSLYHGCDLAYAVSMMIDNAMRGETIANINGKKYQGNSLTRSLQFAKDWQEERWDGHGDELNQFWVVLELNKERLKTKYKVLPYNYWEDCFGKDYEHTNDRNGYGNQYEEFVVGRINNLRKYIDDIYLSDDCLYGEYAEILAIVKRELELRGKDYSESDIEGALQQLGIHKPSPDDLNKTKINESIDYDDEWNTSDTMYLNDTDVVEKNKLPQTFWNWFGNSKIKDNNGNPIICYHTSNVDFDMFKRNPKDNPIGGVAYFFTNSLEAAEHWMDNDPNQMIYDCFLKMENPMYIDGTQDFTTLESRNNLLIKAKSEGYDGAIIRHTDIGLPHYTDEYIVFYSRQIKLIDNVKFGNNRKINENYGDIPMVYPNPTYSEFHDIMRRFTTTGTLSAIIDGDNIYCWDSYLKHHDTMIRYIENKMGIKISDNAICVRFREPNTVWVSAAYFDDYDDNELEDLETQDFEKELKYNPVIRKYFPKGAKIVRFNRKDEPIVYDDESNKLNETHSYYINNVKLYENPSIQWMKKKLNSGTELRILIDGDLKEPYFGEWIVWDASGANHKKVLDSLNLYEEDYISVRLCKDSIRYWGYTKEQMDKLQECEIIQKLYPNGYELINEW